MPASSAIKKYPRFPKTEKTDQDKEYRGREAVILFQGILKRGRGLHQAIQAVASLTQGSLRIIGYGELESELKQVAGTPSIAERIEFKGKVPLEKLLRETGKVRAGLVLFEPLTVNYTYASPNKFFEYVMAGTPLIASDIPTFRQFNSEYEVAILVDPSNITRISEAMNTLLTDEETWNRLHHNCLKARERWNWEAQEQTLLDIYRKFLDT